MVGLLQALEAIEIDLPSEDRPLSFDVLRKVLRRFPKEEGGFFSTAQLIAGFRRFHQDAALSLTEPEFLSLLRFRRTRTGSGVAPVAVFTKPFPCPGQCVFCPNDVRMPKSYLSDEPGAQRAEDNRFDPFRQTWNRLLALHATGHCVSKVELIVLGGTWTFYPIEYQRWFIKRCFDALNKFDAQRPLSPPVIDRTTDEPAPRSGPDPCDRYNKRVLRAALDRPMRGDRETATWQQVQRAHRTNEGALQRCVGLSIETRPDEIDLDVAISLRRLGATKVQIGIQSLDDRILRQNKRGHDVQTTRAALTWLRRLGFKLQAHWMPNLVGATPQSDREDFERLFEDLAIRPDELKAYPCSLVENTDLMRLYEGGSWRPYRPGELVDVLSFAMERTPRYTRLTRMIRDIPATDIVAGSRIGNLREIVERRLEEHGIRSQEIRGRELRKPEQPAGPLIERETSYDTASSKEVFLEYVTPADRLAGFLRLSLPSQPGPIDELHSSALIREVHVYGTALALGSRTDAASQHRGLGRQLIERAARCAREHGFTRLSVISAVGTRNYYRRLGFDDGPLYQHRMIETGRQLPRPLSRA